MNNEYKIVLTVVIDENTGEKRIFLINQNDKNPLVWFMLLNYVGDPTWMPIPLVTYFDRLDTPVNNFVKQLTNKQVLKLYNTPDEKIQIDNFCIETIGVPNDVNVTDFLKGGQ